MADMGRPSKYEPIYCEQIVKFFDRPAYTVLTNSEGEPVYDKQGNPAMRPCDLPTFERFAFSIGVHRETLLNWANTHPDFFDALKKCKDLQKEILIQNGLNGAYDKTFAIFTAKNVTDMRDKQEIDHSSTDGTMTPPKQIEWTIQPTKPVDEKNAKG